MELVKIILKSFGGREIERIFKDYFLLSLLLKQLVVSLFIYPSDNPDIFSIPAEKEQISVNSITVESSEENCEDLLTFRLMFVLAQLEPQPTTVPNDPNLKHK